MNTKAASIIKWCVTLIFATLAVLYAFNIIEASNTLVTVLFLFLTWMSHSTKVEINDKNEEQERLK